MSQVGSPRMEPPEPADLLALLPQDRPAILALLPAAQARDRGKSFLFFEGAGWDDDDAWELALALDPLLVDLIKRIAAVVPDKAVSDAVLARRAPEPDADLLAFHRAALNSYLKPSPSRITITIGKKAAVH